MFSLEFGVWRLLLELENFSRSLRKNRLHFCYFTNVKCFQQFFSKPEHQNLGPGSGFTKAMIRIRDTIYSPHLAMRSEKMWRVCAVPRSHIKHAAPGSRQARHTRTNCWRSVTHSLIFVAILWLGSYPAMHVRYCGILFVIKGTVAID